MTPSEDRNQTRALERQAAALENIAVVVAQMNKLMVTKNATLTEIGKILQKFGESFNNKIDQEVLITTRVCNVENCSGCAYCNFGVAESKINNRGEHDDINQRYEQWLKGVKVGPFETAGNVRLRGLSALLRETSQAEFCGACTRAIDYHGIDQLLGCLRSLEKTIESDFLRTGVATGSISHKQATDIEDASKIVRDDQGDILAIAEDYSGLGVQNSRWVRIRGADNNEDPIDSHDDTRD